MDGNSWENWVFCRSGLSTNVTAAEYGVPPALVSISYYSRRTCVQYVDLSSVIDSRIRAGLNKRRLQYIINLQTDR